MNTFKVSIVTPERIVFEGDVVYLYVPGGGGTMGILANHAPLLASLTPGIIELRPQEPAKSIFLKIQKTGFIEVLKNNVSILLDAADSFAIPVVPAS